MRVVPCGDIDAIQTKLMLFFSIAFAKSTLSISVYPDAKELILGGGRSPIFR